MKIKYLLFCYFLILPTQLFSQNYLLYGDKCFGGNKADQDCFGMFHDSTHLIIAGKSKSNINGDKTDPLCDSLFLYEIDNWIIKFDTAFNIIWNKSIGGSKSEEAPYFLKINQYNEIIISTQSRSDSTCDKTEFSKGGTDYWFYKLEANGNILWDYNFGGNLSESCPKSIKLQSGNFITCGLSDSPISGDKSILNYGQNDYWVIKFDSLGNKIWDNVYGGTDVEYGCGANYKYNFDIIETQGEEFIIAGTTKSPASGSISDSSKGKNDIWIILIDVNGNKIWDKRYGGTENDDCQRIIKTSDNGYIICGNSASPQSGDVSEPLKSLSGDCWILKLDSLGNKQWDKRYGGDLGVSGTWIENAPDSGYWISGWVQGGIANDVTEAAYGIQEDYFILKIDNYGNKIWDKRFGGSGYNFGSSFVIMPDESIFLFGHSDTSTSAVKTDAGHGLEDYWVVHFKYEETTGIDEISMNQIIDVFPNPANSYINIPVELLSSELYVYDIAGREIIQSNKISTQKLDIAPLNSGTYFLNFFMKNTVYHAKVIVYH